jgi:hypothetical protein
MVMVKATKNSEAGILPGDPRAPASYEKLFEEMGKFNEEARDGRSSSLTSRQVSSSPKRKVVRSAARGHRSQRSHVPGTRGMR